MNEDSKAFKTKLPYGQELNELLIQKYLTDANITQILKLKGIYYGLKDKQNTVPILASTVLTPSEFEFIREKRNTKEDSVKRKSSVVPWSSKKTLFDEMPKNLDPRKIIDTRFQGFELIGSPRFVPIDGDQNRLQLKFEIERKDGSKSWCNSETKFEGSVEVGLINGNLELKIVKHNTSQETEDVAQQITNFLKKSFRDNGCIQEDKIDIVFSAFTNEERINYFWLLTGKTELDNLKFDCITDIDVKPDNSLNIPADLSIEWMANKINKLRISGKDIQNTFFITDKACHPYLIFWRMEAKYIFNDHIAKGSCKLNFEFNGYGKKANPNSELTISVNQLSLDKGFKHISHSKVIRHLLDVIDSLKIKLYTKHIESKNNNLNQKQSKDNDR